MTRSGISLVAALTLVGCQVYDPSLVETATLRGPPPRPTADMDGDDGEEYAWILRDVVLDQGSGAWEDIGLDLDGVDTRAPNPVSRCRPPTRSTPPVDGNEGIDNIFGAELFPLVDVTIRAQGMGSVEETARAAQDKGSGPILRLRGWNGTDNDARVDAVITNSIYAVPAAPDGSIPEFEVENFIPVHPTTRERFDLPVWDGTDYAFMRTDTFFEGDIERPLIRDDNAYVSGGLVVARLPERFEILFPAEELGLLVRLTDATAIGRISADRLTLENAVVAGRWRILDLLATAEDVGVCRGTAQSDILEGQLDSIADVRATPGTGGEGVQCDAISLGVGFTGTAVHLAGLTPGAEIRNLCDMPLVDAGPGSPDAGAPDAGPPAGDGG